MPNKPKSSDRHWGSNLLATNCASARAAWPTAFYASPFGQLNVPNQGLGIQAASAGFCAGFQLVNGISTCYEWLNFNPGRLNKLQLRGSGKNEHQLNKKGPVNYKLLFPTYRNRYLFIKRNLEQFSKVRKPARVLNLGTGEGDYDRMIAAHCRQLVSCDINEADIAWARQINSQVPNLEYRVENALQLSFEDGMFDMVISVDVIEHVGQPERMISEIARVLKPGGLALITFPQTNFPITYDPVNYIAGKRLIAQGAYAFGHDELIDPTKFKQWIERSGLEVLEETNLSGHLVALAEMYWSGVVQRLFKANARNAQSSDAAMAKLRPTTKEPFLLPLTDAFLAVDRFVFGKARHSVGKGFVLNKR